MSRKHKKRKKRDLILNYKYHDEVVTKLINCIMKKGKKSLAEKIVFNLFNFLELKLKLNPIKLINEALDNIAPSMEIVNKKLGGTSYQVPIDISPERRKTLAVRWFVNFARKRKESGMVYRLIGELLDSIIGKSSSIKKKESIHKLANLNQAFSHLVW